MNDTTESVKDAVDQRVKNHFFGNFVISFLIYNWEFSVRLFFYISDVFKNEKSVDSLIHFINDFIVSTSWISSVIYPLLCALGITIVLVLFSFLGNFVEEVKKRIVNKMKKTTEVIAMNDLKYKTDVSSVHMYVMNVAVKELKALRQLIESVKGLKKNINDNDIQGALDQVILNFKSNSDVISEDLNELTALGVKGQNADRNSLFNNLWGSFSYQDWKLTFKGFPKYFKKRSFCSSCKGRGYLEN